MSSLSDRRTATLVRPVRANVGEANSSATFAATPAHFNDELRDGGLLADAEAAASHAAWSTGYREGLDEGMACGRALSAVEQAAADRRSNTLRELISETAESVIAEQRLAISEVEHALVVAAFEIAEAILAREIRFQPRSAEEALVAALALAPERMPCVVRMNPADCEALGEVEERFPLRDLSVQADESIDPGDCVINVPTGRIELRLADAIARARIVLLAGRETEQ